jgi:hypothetical protein
MARPKKFDSDMVSKSLLLTKSEVEKAVRVGNGEFSEGVRKCLEFYDEGFTEEYATAEIELLKSLLHCNELTHNKLIKDLARFEKHKHDAARAISTVDDNKLAFLQKAKRTYLDIKLRVPDKAGFTFRGWLQGPANTDKLKELWKNEKAAYEEIANYIKDRTWMNTED